MNCVKCRNKIYNGPPDYEDYILDSQNRDWCEKCASEVLGLYGNPLSETKDTLIRLKYAGKAEPFIYTEED